MARSQCFHSNRGVVPRRPCGLRLGYLENMKFTKHGSGFYSLDFDDSYEPSVESGKTSVPWEPGLKLTQVRPRSARSDGEAALSVWDGAPWVASPPVGDGVSCFPFLEGKLLFFKEPSSLMFAGSMVVGGRVRPQFFLVSTHTVWPGRDGEVADGDVSLDLTVAEAAYVAGLGKLISFRGRFHQATHGDAVVRELTRAEYELAGCYSQPGGFGVLRPAGYGLYGGWGAGVNYVDQLKGVSVKKVLGVTNNGLSISSLVITEPSVAAQHEWWFGLVPPGTRLDYSDFHGPGRDLDGVALIVEFNDLCSGMFTEVAHVFNGSGVAVYPKEIGAGVVVGHVEGRVCGASEGAFLGESVDGLVSFRQMAHLDASDVPKKRLWLVGVDAPEAGAFYCEVSVAEKLPPSNRRSLRARYEALQERFPWMALEQASASDDELEQHDEWVKKSSKGHWGGRAEFVDIEGRS